MTLSLTEIFKYLYAVLREKGTAPSLHDRARWNNLFYLLQMADGPWRHMLDLRFDWDASYPSSPQLCDVMATIRIVAGPGDVSEDMLDFWRYKMGSLDPVVKGPLEEMIGLAVEVTAPYSTDYVEKTAYRAVDYNISQLRLIG